jgi:F-box/leucine-rich repeat protein 2/20
MLCIRNNIREEELINFNINSNNNKENNINNSIIGIDGSFIDLTDNSIKYIINSLINIKIVKLIGCNLITDISIYYIQNKFSHSLLEIHLSGTFITDNGILDFSRKCTNLVLIDIMNCTMLSEKSILYISQYSKNLKYLITNILYCGEIFLSLGIGCPLLREVDLVRFINNFPIGQLVDIFQSLETIDLYDYNKLESIEFSDSHLIRIAENFTNIKRIVLFSDDITDIGIAELAKNCTQLNEIYLSGCKNIGDKSIEMITEYCPNIRILELNNCSFISNVSMLYIASKLKFLEKLYLQYTNVTDIGLNAIFIRCKFLREIFLEGCDISEKVLDDIHDLAHNLKTVNISKNPKINKNLLLFFLENMQIENIVRENDTLLMFNELQTTLEKTQEDSIVC